jgi:hypothetical protein
MHVKVKAPPLKREKMFIRWQRLTKRLHIIGGKNG